MIIISYFFLQYLWKLNLKKNLTNNNQNKNQKVVVESKTLRILLCRKYLRTSYCLTRVIASNMYAKIQIIFTNLTFFNNLRFSANM